MATVTFIFALCMVFMTTVHAVTTDLFFDDFTDSCDSTQTVNTDDQMIITQQKPVPASTFSTCVIIFQAGTAGQRLCATINKMQFSDSNVVLEIFDKRWVAGDNPVATYQSGVIDQVVEHCPSGQFMSIRVVAAPSTTGDLSKLNINIQVANMAGNQRINYMNSDCGATRHVDGGEISVRPHRDAVTGALAKNCPTTFTYDGTNDSLRICYRYEKITIPPCSPTLKVKEGTTIQFSVVATFDCKTSASTPFSCLNSKSLVLDMSRVDTDAGNEPSGYFIVRIKDGVYTGNPNPNGGNKNQGWSIGTIIGVVIGVIAVVVVIIIIAVVCVRQKKGHLSVPQDEHDAHKL